MLVNKMYITFFAFFETFQLYFFTSIINIECFKKTFEIKYSQITLISFLHINYTIKLLK